MVFEGASYPKHHYPNHYFAAPPHTAITSRVGIAHHFAKPITVELCGQCPPYNLWLIDVKTAVVWLFRKYYHKEIIGQIK
jgi:hypothetical protein